MLELLPGVRDTLPSLWLELVPQPSGVGIHHKQLLLLLCGGALLPGGSAQAGARTLWRHEHGS